MGAMQVASTFKSFKPYYKWNTFNTEYEKLGAYTQIVLNLIINGIPSILNMRDSMNEEIARF